MSEPVWLLRPVIEAIHGMQIAEHGGAAGLRDAGMLDSALARPITLYGYGERDVFRLAAAYAFSLVRNHPFVDGNKRAALLASYIFLRINGHALVATEVSAAITVLALAAGEMEEDDFTAWLRANCEPA